MAHVALTELAHEIVGRRLSEGDVAVDATVGNGYDCAFLARAVGVSGQVHGFDVQSQAIDRTKARLEQTQLADRVQLHLVGHQDLASRLPGQLVGSVAAAMFNLGYLPGAGREVVTQAATTEAALDQVMRFLRRGGVLTVLVYVGQAGGREELALLERCAQRWRADGHVVERTEGVGAAPPVLFSVAAKDDTGAKMA